MGSEIYQIISSIIVLIIAIIIGKDANERGMNGWIWGIVVLFLSIIGLVIYFYVRKPKTDNNTKQLNINYIVDNLKIKGYVVEYRDNSAVKGHVILYDDEEYKIVLNKANNIDLKLVIPTSVRIKIIVIYGLIIIIIASFLISFLTILVGIFVIIFLLPSTFIADAFYKNKCKNKTVKINEEVRRALY